MSENPGFRDRFTERLDRGIDAFERGIDSYEEWFRRASWKQLWAIFGFPIGGIQFYRMFVLEVDFNGFDKLLLGVFLPFFVIAYFVAMIWTAIEFFLPDLIKAGFWEVVGTLSIIVGALWFFKSAVTDPILDGLSKMFRRPPPVQDQHHHHHYHYTENDLGAEVTDLERDDGRELP